MYSFTEKSFIKGPHDLEEYNTGRRLRITGEATSDFLWPLSLGATGYTLSILPDLIMRAML